MNDWLIQLIILLLDVHFNKLETLKTFETILLLISLLLFISIFSINQKIDLLVAKAERKGGITRRRGKIKR
ncbi:MULTISPECIES: hypothetical protein [Bacillus]|uniref:hypothetical protein n=1 Tax=Bacillus TaxID=1386 RepID=UPI000BB918D6|nr:MULTISPECIES: hypothetical protein [Bacillus]